MTDTEYRHSVKRRLSVLFSPIRLALFLGSVVWLIVLNVIYISNSGNPSWAGPASAFPILVWVTVMLMTDSRYRRAGNGSSSPNRPRTRPH